MRQLPVSRHSIIILTGCTMAHNSGTPLEKLADLASRTHTSAEADSVANPKASLGADPNRCSIWNKFLLTASREEIRQYFLSTASAGEPEFVLRVVPDPGPRGYRVEVPEEVIDQYNARLLAHITTCPHCL